MIKIYIIDDTYRRGWPLKQDYAITLCGRFDNSKQRFPIQMDIACGNSCLIISTTTVAKQSVRIADYSGRWVARWTQSAWCEISADVVAMAHATTSLFIFHENESGRGEIVGPTFPTTRSRFAMALSNR